MTETKERRCSNRLTVNLNAERLSCSKNCSVFIENLSENGIHMITAPAKTSNLFVPGSEVELKLKTADGETIKLHCNVKWSYDNSPEDMTNSVGLEIIDPPLEYKEFIKNLH
jgi:hypothetical protein